MHKPPLLVQKIKRKKYFLTTRHVKKTLFLMDNDSSNIQISRAVLLGHCCHVGDYITLKENLYRENQTEGKGGLSFPDALNQNDGTEHLSPYCQHSLFHRLNSLQYAEYQYIHTLKQLYIQVWLTLPYVYDSITYPSLLNSRK